MTAPPAQVAHCGKVNEKTGEMTYGLARNLRDALPKASFIGITGMPIEQTDANILAVFGDHISIYDIQSVIAEKDNYKFSKRIYQRLEKTSYEK